MKNIVHIVGTGTIGEPLIGLLSLHKDKLGIDEVTFNKNTPLLHDKSKVDQLLYRGAKLATDKKQFKAFKEIGISPSFEKEEAIQRASVVIDCTPGGIGLQNKREFYQKYKDSVKGFIAQGSEFGFGSMFAHNIVDHPDDQFIQVVSCNTHNIASLVTTLQRGPEQGLISGDFVCIRRSNDISQDSGFVPGPSFGKHDDPEYGTHHARDAANLLKNHCNGRLFSSAIKLNTQYMHSIRFKLTFSGFITTDDAKERFRLNPYVATTCKKSANSVFSFGRDYGVYGRILSQTVIYEPSITTLYYPTINTTTVYGLCFTPQDGNSLLSSISSTLHFLDPENVDERLSYYNKYIFQEI